MSEPGPLIGGKYRLLRELGAGGMGVVHEARNELTEKRVAIKRLRPELASRPQLVQRMLREAQASARIRHPNVVDVLDLGTEGDSVFLVMEFLEGETLGARLRRGGLSVGEVLRLLLPAMRGVAAGHALGIVHRDIKPENIFLARVADQREPVPKVLDFGISKLLHGDDLSLTESGTTLGTPLYMSYEQLTGARDVDGRADVYAFGAILYEALTGRTPFQGETLGSLAVQVATTKPRRPSDLSNGLPRALDHVVMHAIESQREARFASLDSFQQALAPFVGLNHVTRPLGEPNLAGTATLPAARVLPDSARAAVPVARRPRARLWLWSVLLAASVALAWQLWPTQRQPSKEAAVTRPATETKPEAPTPATAEAPRPPSVVPSVAQPAAEPRTERVRPRRQRPERAPAEAVANPPPAEQAPAAATPTPNRLHRAGTPKLDQF